MIHAIESSMPTVGQCYCLGDWSYDCVRISTVQERRFQPILVNEPTVDEAIDILNAVMPRYEEFHGVRYTPFAIDAAARLAERCIADRSLSDKAIDFLDEAGSTVKLEDDGSDDGLPDDFFVVTVMFSST